MISFPLIVILTNGIVGKVGASSVNNGPSMGVPPISHSATTSPNSIQQRNANQGPGNVQSAIGNTSERESLDELSITDAASALASNYAAANIVTGNIIDNEKAKSVGGNSQSTTGGGWFGKILGKGSTSDNEKNAQSSGSSDKILPPPPPPPLQQQTSGHQQSNSGSIKQAPPQTKQQQTPQNFNSYVNNYPAYNHQQSYIDPAAYQNLLYELDESTLREMTLTHQLHNMSMYVDSLTSESENLVMRIDVLTERLADANANFNFVHNRNLELEKNCTQLTATVDNLKEEIAGYESKFLNMEDEKSDNEKILAELRGELRRVTDELEQLACLVETERFEMEKSEVLKGFKKKQEHKRRKKRGFWAWLFGFESDDRVDDSSEGEQERLRAAQELARSTLLHALQTERASVEELEASLITLQRNNSAIMDVVQSRNSLINELNDRVAVFEEDKMVLKAALRQLQKEIREEAPKLEKAQENERRLREQLDQLKAEYEEESEIWQQHYEEGEASWNRTKDELMLIGSYVDQLEDRLATFAIAKKEIELREKQCQELEAEAKKHKEEANSWKSQVETLAKEQGETKPLLEDLVKERAQTQVKMEGLLRDIEDLQVQIESWKQKVDEAEHQCEEIKSQSARQLFLKVEGSKREWEAEMAQQIEEEKQRWESMKTRELQATIENERMMWQSQSSQAFDRRLAEEKADLEEIFQDRQSHLEANFAHKLNAKLSEQKIEVETTLHEQFELRLKSERAKWEKETEQEIEQRLFDERASWEASIAKEHFNDTSSVEDEVERASTKVYNMLQKNGISFGIDEPPIEPMKEIVQALSGPGSQGQTTHSAGNISSSVGLDETKNSPLVNATTTKVQQREPLRSDRNVPFRSVRKAFSRATGMHGIITPSTVQLRKHSIYGQRHSKKRSNKKKLAQDGLRSQKNDSTRDNMTIPHASSDAELENHLWSDENENNGDIPADVSSRSEDVFQQENSAWSYEAAEGGPELMSMMEPPPLPDFDNR